MKKGIHIVNLKKSICHRTTFYVVFNMSSCRKPEIQNGFPKITKIKLICFFFLQNSSEKSLTRFVLSCLNSHSIGLKKRKKKKRKKVSLRWDSNPQSLGFEAAENALKQLS